MEEVSCVSRGKDEDEMDEYYSVEDEDGVLRCSCGSELVKMDEESWRCGQGYPIYKFEDGEVLLDRNGNLMLKGKPHDEGDKNEV